MASQNVSDVTGDIATSGKKNIRKFVKMWSKVTTSYKKFNIIYDVGQKHGTMS